MSEADSTGRRARFGPFHRIESPTQTASIAREQRRSSEVWGRVPFGGRWPQVQAYVGPLPQGAMGVEFYTEIPPDVGGRPHRATWSGTGRRHDVRTEDGFAKISCVITQNTQEPEP